MTSVELNVNGKRILHISTALHPDDVDDDNVVMILREVLYALENPKACLPYHD